MDAPTIDTIGEAVFIRTDVPNYVEERLPFCSLEELINVCTTPQPNLTLEKVIVYSLAGEAPKSLTLSYISASKGRRGRVKFVDGEKVPTED
ncbi:MAG: hypothetical protein ACPGVU_04170 [Limisphaerales bacterium]